MKKRKKHFKKIINFFLIIIVLTGAYWVYSKYQGITQVEKYQGIIEKEVPGDVYQQQVIKAIILTESKGKGIDVMQSQESQNQEKIKSPKASIQQGNRHLQHVLTLAKEKELDFWSGIQAYNFGEEYLNFLVKENKSENSLTHAEKYSKEVLAKRLGNTDSKKYRYLHSVSLLKGGYLYQNGGNFFYAKLVKNNLFLIQTYERVKDFFSSLG